MATKARIFGQRKPAARLGGSTAARDRSASYDRLRAAVLADNPVCRYCLAQKRLTPSTIVDHIVALSLGGSNLRDNLTGSCRSCNADKAIVEQRVGRMGWSPADALLDPELARWIAMAR